MTQEEPYHVEEQPYVSLPYNEVICLHDGRVMSVHSADACASEKCPIHRPSDHKLRSAALFWDPDKRMMMRRCAHEALHPDPDDMKILLWPKEGTHECDGCCEMTG